MKAQVRRAVLTFIAAGATVAATSFTPAGADEVIVIEIPVISRPPVQLQIQGDEVITVLPGGQVDMPAQCAPTGDVGQDVTTGTLGQFCVGKTTPTGAAPLSVGGLGDLAELVKQPKAEAALNPLVVEGIQSARAVYDVPNDGRILQHGRPQLRAFLLERLLDIMDKEAYGVPLTATERAALSFVEGEFAQEDRALAEAAYDEFLAYKDLGCGYTPPPAPAGVTSPVPLPNAVKEWCRGSHSVLANAMVFAPPIPSVEEFEAWGAYRVAGQPGSLMGQIDEPAMQDNMRDLVAVSATIGGLAAAAGAAGVTAALVGSVATLSGAVVAAIGSHAAVATWTSSGVIAGSTAGVGAAAAASVVAVVIVFIIVTAISIWMIAENEAIGTDLKDAVDEARAGTDPLGLREARKTLGGKPLRSEFDPASPPAYRSAAMLTKLAARLTHWTTVTEAGQALADPTGLWGDNATGPDDIRPQVRVGSGEWETRDSFTVDNVDKDMTVRFDRGWMITRRAGESERAGLSFLFDTPEGRRIATRAPASVGGWYVTDPTGSQVTGEHVTALRIRDAQGRDVRVRLLPASLTNLGGPRPTLVGPLWTSRVHTLRANPVNADGTVVPLDEAESDFTYAWVVTRLDRATGTWVEVQTSSLFAPKLTPAQAGDYHARVTMTSVAAPDQEWYGAVEFTVGPPPMTTPVLELVDDGSFAAELDLQVQLPIAVEDDVTVAVTWPPAIGQAQGPTHEEVLTCVPSGPLECTTPRTGLSDMFTQTLTSDTDIRKPVRVELTSGLGDTQTHELFLDNPGRPTIAAPQAGRNDGTRGAVTVTETHTQVEFPLGTAYDSYVAATLVPGQGGGQGFALVDPVTGTTSGDRQIVPGNPGVWVSVEERDDGTSELLVWGLPRITDLGTYELPVVVQQTNTNRALVVVVVHVVPAAGDRFRAGIQSAVDPADFTVDEVPEFVPVVLGGRSGQPAYSGQMCVSMEYASFPSPVETKCGPVGDFVDGQGVAEPFPYRELYPTGLRSGMWRTSAWLTGAGERVDTAPLGMSFLLTEDATYPAPRVELARPSVKGKPKVGKKLRSVVAADPAEARLGYRWLRNGKAIKGAKGAKATYVLRRADRGKRLQVRVTATLTDWSPATGTSKKTTKVRR